MFCVEMVLDILRRSKKIEEGRRLSWQLCIPIREILKNKNERQCLLVRYSQKDICCNKALVFISWQVHN
jgi:hypothetical protein